jgi:hypothetical protein
MMRRPPIEQLADDEFVEGHEGLKAVLLELQRSEAVRRRQQRLFVLLTGCLSLVCVALAVSNATLGKKLAAARASARSTAVAVSPPLAPQAPAPAAVVVVPPPPATTAVTVTETEESPPAPPAPVPPPAPRDAPRTSAAIRPRAKPGPVQPAQIETDPIQRTADWMVEHYGPGEAEQRAETFAGLYPADDPKRAYWQAVLSHVRGGR